MFATLLSILYFSATAALFIYALQCYLMVWLFRRKVVEARAGNAEVMARGEEILEEHVWPAVVTQIPIYNEANVAERVIRAAVAMEYAEGRHEVQVLDDSTDGTREIVDRVVEELCAGGGNVRVIRREGRTGFKAGALKLGMTQSSAGLVAIFDCDFIPPVDYLKKIVPFFCERKELGIVQARWAHVNENASVLTRAQSIGIDGHFMVEQCARAFNGLFMNFNGTAGMWRREAIEDAGGWSADTLTEDIDLSYRAQLAGWKAHYVPEIGVPAEIPEDVAAFKGQQFRWAKGSIQTALKILPRVFGSQESPLAKLVAFFHLTHYAIHPLMLMLGLLALPMLLFVNLPIVGIWMVVLGLVIVVTLVAPNAVYVVSQRELHRDWRRRLIYLPAVTCVGVGIALTNTRAVLEALVGIKSGFVRTPKRGDGGGVSYRAGSMAGAGWEVAIGLYCAVGLAVYCAEGKWLIGPFLAIYVVGFLFVGIRGLREQVGYRREAARDTLGLALDSG